MTSISKSTEKQLHSLILLLQNQALKELGTFIAKVTIKGVIRSNQIIIYMQQTEFYTKIKRKWYTKFCHETDWIL